jgi:hypothetical protein
LTLTFVDLDGNSYQVHFDDYEEQVRDPRTQLTSPSYHVAVVRPADKTAWHRRRRLKSLVDRCWSSDRAQKGTVMVEIVLVADPALSPNVLSDAEIAAAAVGLQDWVNSGPGRAWSQGFYKVSSVPRVGARGSTPVLPAGTDHVWLVWLKTNSDVPGAAGYHAAEGGAPFARIFVVDILAYGMSWTAVASHEIAEMMVNRWVDLGIMGTYQGGVGCYTMEACDPCERFGSLHAYGAGKTIVVSDVCTPAYFRPGAPGPYSLYGHCPAPLTPAPGGRQLVASLGQAHDVTVVPFGEGAEPRARTSAVGAMPRISSVCERA